MLFIHDHEFSMPFFAILLSLESRFDLVQWKEVASVGRAQLALSKSCIECVCLSRKQTLRSLCERTQKTNGRKETE